MYDKPEILYRWFLLRRIMKMFNGQGNFSTWFFGWKFQEILGSFLGDWEGNLWVKLKGLLGPWKWLEFWEVSSLHCSLVETQRALVKTPRIPATFENPPKTHRKSNASPKKPSKNSIKTCLFLRNFCRKKTGFSWMTERLIKIFRIVRWLNLPIGVSFVDWTRQYFNCIWVELELFLSGSCDVATSMVFSYRVVSETGNLFCGNSLQSLSSNFEQILGNLSSSSSRSKFPAKNLSVQLELFLLDAGGHFVSCSCRWWDCGEWR